MDGKELYALIKKNLDGNRIELINLLIDDLKEIEIKRDYSNAMEAYRARGLEREVKDLIKKLEDIF